VSAQSWHQSIRMMIGRFLAPDFRAIGMIRIFCGIWGGRWSGFTGRCARGADPDRHRFRCRWHDLECDSYADIAAARRGR
jgi:hypothetical protein